MHSLSSWVSCPIHSMCVLRQQYHLQFHKWEFKLAVVLQEQSLVDIEMPGQYMNGDEPSPDGIVFLEGISSNVHVSSLAAPLELVLLNPVFVKLVTSSRLLP